MGSQQLVKLTKQAARDIYLTGLNDSIDVTVTTPVSRLGVASSCTCRQGPCSFLSSARMKECGKLPPFSARLCAV